MYKDGSTASIGDTEAFSDYGVDNTEFAIISTVGPG